MTTPSPDHEKMVGFTRGPWTFSKRGLRVYGGQSGCTVVANIPLGPNYKDNARLIAAAPDLYAAAERALNYITNTEGSLGITLESGEMLRAALTKAQGHD